MFRTVRCRGYYKKIHDSHCIVKLDGSETESGMAGYFYADITKDEWKEIEDFCGILEFLKTYYQYTEKEFVGVVVGMKMLTITGWLYVDTAFDYEGRDIGPYVGKQPEKVVKCALVYYGCNKSRYVPLDDLTILEEEGAG